MIKVGDAVFRSKADAAEYILKNFFNEETSKYTDEDVCKLAKDNFGIDFSRTLVNKAKLAVYGREAEGVSEMRTESCCCAGKLKYVLTVVISFAVGFAVSFLDYQWVKKYLTSFFE
jgi:hypothetical protein